jgi:hypothetical protein
MGDGGKFTTLFCSSLAGADVNTATTRLVQLEKLISVRFLSPSQFTCKDTCTKFAPYFSGINEDACSIYGGKWCPSLPDCSFLKVCVANATRDAETNNMTGTVAYRKYLELSPNISDVMSIEECGNARAYFGFDPFFPNDKQICDDVKQLRLTPDFEILNSFATGGSGTDSSDEGLMKPATRK